MLILDNGRRVVPAVKRCNSVLGKILLAIITVQLVLSAPLLSANASTGIIIVVNQTATSISADYYFNNLTAAFDFINDSSYNYIIIYVEAGTYNETFPNTYVLNNVTIIGRNALIKGNDILVLHLANSKNVTFIDMSFYNFTSGIQLENSSMIRFLNSNLTKMTLPSLGEFSLPIGLNRPTVIHRAPTRQYLKKKLVEKPASYMLSGKIFLTIILGGLPAILINNTSNVIIENTVLSGSYGGIFILNSTNITIRNVTIYNMSGTLLGGGGIGGYNSNNILIDNVTIHDVNGTGIYLYSPNTTTFLTGITITNIIVYNVDDTGIDVDAQNGLIANINGNNIRFDLIDVYGFNNRVENVTGSDIGFDGIYFGSNYSSISNIVFDNVSIGLDFDFSIGNNASNISISNASDIGIYLSFSNNTLIYNARIENSVTGVYVEYAENNTIANVSAYSIGNGGGIELDTSLNINLVNIVVNISTYDGIGFYSTNNTTLQNIIVYDSLWPIYTWNANNVSFENIAVYSTGAVPMYGVEIEYSKNVSFHNLLVRNITEPDLWYVGAPFPIGLHAYYNSSITVFNASILDVYNASSGGVGVLINNSSASLNKLYINNSYTGVMTCNNTNGLTIADTTIANAYYGVYLDNWTGNASIILTEINNTVYGVFASKSNLTINNLRIHNNLQVGIDLYNASNASITNIYIDTANTGLLVDNVNWYYGVNVTVENATIITGATGIYVFDISYASNITLNNINIQGGGVLVETDMSAWFSPPLYNLTITNLTITNASSGVGLALHFNSTPLNLTLIDLEIRNSANGLLINGAGVSSGWGTISRVELANITSGPALVIENSTNLTLTNIYIHDTGSHGIVLGHSIGNVSNITIDNLGLANINGTPIIAENSTNISFTNTYINNPTIHIDYTIKGEASIYAVNTTLVPPPTGNETPLGIYANVTLGSTNSWILLSYTYPVSLGYPIVKWMYYNEATNTWENMPTTIIPLNSTHNKVLTNHTGSTLLGVYGTSPPVGGKLELYTTKNDNPLPLILAAIGLTITTIIAYTLNKNKQK